MSVFLGVDVGGTKTHTVAVNEHGDVLGFVLDSAGGTHRVGLDQFIRVLERSIALALKPSGKGIHDVAAISMGIAGLDWPEDLFTIQNTLHQIPMPEIVDLHNDGDLPLAAGCKNGWGVAVIAGTGSVVTGIGPDDQYARSTGGSTLLGELGGAKELVDLAIQAVSRAYIGRGPATSLTKLMLNWMDEQDIAKMLSDISRQRVKVKPDFAVPIAAEAAAGDQVAQEIMRVSGEDLGETAVAIVRQLGIQHQPFEMVLSGSMFKSGPHFTDPLRLSVVTAAPLVTFSEIETAPVIGAVILAMKKAGADFSAIRQHLIDQTNDILERNPAPIGSVESPIMLI